MFEETSLSIDVSNIAPLDLDDKEVQLSTFRGKVLVMVGGGQRATNDAQEWAKALEEKCKAIGAEFVGLAFIFHNSSFVKSTIKYQIRKSGGLPFLIFWEEAPVKAMGVSDYEHSNVFVVDKKGILRYRIVGNFSESALAKVMSQAVILLMERKIE